MFPFWIRKRVPTPKRYQQKLLPLLLLGVVVMLLSDFRNSEAFFISKLTVIKLRIQIEDNTLHNRTVHGGFSK